MNLVVSNLNIIIPIHITQVLTKRFAYVRENDNRQPWKPWRERFWFEKAPKKHGQPAAEVLPDKSWDLWGRWVLSRKTLTVRCCALRKFREIWGDLLWGIEVLLCFFMFFCQVSTLHLRLPGIQTDGIETCDTPLVGQQAEILNLQGVGLALSFLKWKQKKGRTVQIDWIFTRYGVTPDGRMMFLIYTALSLDQSVVHRLGYDLRYIPQLKIIDLQNWIRLELTKDLSKQILVTFLGDELWPRG